MTHTQNILTLEPGRRLGAYRIIRPLDAGGMGQVYEALHETLGSRCAIKVFANDSQRQAFLRKRFFAEGKLLAEFRHPRIVRVTDLQIDAETGVPYFAMDLVLSPNGQPRTLEAARRDGVDEDQVASWLRDICDGLAYIHSKGVVHRDISLENVMIGPDGHAVITDFGISRIFDAGLRERVDITRFTMVELGTTELKMGKAPYMAPELTRPRPAHASPASDAWALGILIFRLLTGFWFERERRENAMAMLGGLKYDWAKLLGSLLDDRPAMRLEKGDISTLPNRLKLQGPRRGARRLLVVSVSLALALILGLVLWRIVHDDPLRKARAGLDLNPRITERDLHDFEQVLMLKPTYTLEDIEK